MTLSATRKTAFLAGLWCGIGVPTWQMLPFSMQNGTFILDLVALLIFLFVPGALFIAGVQFLNQGFRELLSKSYWLSFSAVGIRSIFWLFGAAIGLFIFGTVVEYFGVVSWTEFVPARQNP